MYIYKTTNIAFLSTNKLFEMSTTIKFAILVICMSAITISGICGIYYAYRLDTQKTCTCPTSTTLTPTKVSPMSNIAIQNYRPKSTFMIARPTNTTFEETFHRTALPDNTLISANNGLTSTKPCSVLATYFFKYVAKWQGWVHFGLRVFGVDNHLVRTLRSILKFLTWYSMDWEPCNEVDGARGYQV
ncbi:hypothetical protein TWF730_003908 [Orbilia blumenaviensis]|uniref:Uncharacterized protein n=1 Tax=Orbilia blumenaviensis TaxID=1796055 RepID=A0AAV9U1G4_9PEZI